jgi:hypothetical protein
VSTGLTSKANICSGKSREVASVQRGGAQRMNESSCAESIKPSYISISTLVTLAGGRMIWTCASWDSTARSVGLMALGVSKVL